MSRPRCVKDNRRELAHHECPGGKTHNKGNLWEGLRVDGFYDIPWHDAGPSGRGVHGLPYGISLAFRCRQSAPQPDRDPYDPKREEGIACGVWVRVAGWPWSFLLGVMIVRLLVQPSRRPKDFILLYVDHTPAIDSDLRQEIIGEKDECVKRIMKGVTPA